jgi:hypothetical protein
VNENGNVRGRLTERPRVVTRDGAGTLALARFDGDRGISFAVVEHDDGSLSIYDGDEVELEPTS